MKALLKIALFLLTLPALCIYVYGFMAGEDSDNAGTFILFAINSLFVWWLIYKVFFS